MRTSAILVAALPGSALTVFYGALLYYRIRNPAPGAAVERVITLFPYTVVVPAVIAVVMIAIDGWFLFRPRVRSLFAPFAVVGAVLLFWSQGLFQTTLFSHPIWYLFAGVVLAVLVVLHQRVVADRQSPVRGGVRRLWFLVPLIAIVAGLTYTTWSTRSVEAGEVSCGRRRFISIFPIISSWNPKSGSTVTLSCCTVKTACHGTV